MVNNQDYSSLKVAVGTSTKKDAYTAGKELAEKTLHKLGWEFELGAGLTAFQKALID